MPPKKRDKDAETSKQLKYDHASADHDLFLQAFEKPTQIYRFLRTRNMLSPIFLNRTLSYMKKRMSRSNRSRTGFKVDSLLAKVTAKRSNELQPNNLGGYMTLTFLGFYDKSLDDSKDYQVKVETLLLKVCHKKRKESSSAVIEVSVGNCSVPLNPSTSEPPAMASAVSIASDTFSPSQGPNVKSYMLLLRVTVTLGSVGNGEITNGDSDEPLSKKIKPSTAIVENSFTKLYGSELVVYDKHNRCLLTAGEYDLVMTTGHKANSPKKALAAHWENMPGEEEIKGDTNPYDVFKTQPLLKLKLSWSQESKTGLVNIPKAYQCNGDSSIKRENGLNGTKDGRVNGTAVNSGVDKVKTEKPQQNGEKSEKMIQIMYQFVYNNNSRQQTEACDDLHCPWCSLDCGTLYSLLKHLKLCHSRFNFAYSPMPGGARIDVSINDSYDGSYIGSPHDLIANQGRCRSAPGPRAGPGRRAPLTHLLVCRPPPRPAPSLAEFLQPDENEISEAQRPYITGHNRLYHHTITCLPVHPKELDIDSEEETDPLWLQQKTMMMIDEFTDVNEGEKELMKMWNLHVMKYNFVGDCQIPLACQTFLQLKGKELLEKNLYRNFVLHMSSLHDFSLISPVAMYQILQTLNQMLAENTEAKDKMRDSLKKQQEHWLKVGKFQQPTILEQKEKLIVVKQVNAEISSPLLRRKTSNLSNANRMGFSNGDTKRKMSTGSIQSRKRSSLSERKNSA